MPNPVRVLFAGESWMTHSVHTKGFDSFDMASYHEGGTEMRSPPFAPAAPS